MTNIILTTPEELRAIVSETVSQSLAGFTQPRNEPDNLTPDVAVEVLERHGFLISKARLYKLTAKKEVPFRKWKSHATLTLLATQDCPLWLQYD